MGYYDNQKIANFTGRNTPYDVKDILLGTNAITGGVDKLVANEAADRVYNQQQQANQYVSGLLRNTNASNYDDNMSQIRTLLPYASPQMQAQATALTADINNTLNRKISQQNADATTMNANTNLLNTNNMKKYQDSEIGLKGRELDQKDDQFKTQKEWQEHIFNNLSAEQRAMLGLKSQELGISASHIALMREVADQGKYKMMPVPRFAVVNGKQVRIGTDLAAMNIKDGSIAWRQPFDNGNSVDDFVKSSNKGDDTLPTIYPSSIKIKTKTPISTLGDYQPQQYNNADGFNNPFLKQQLLGY
jgi:hypothetical protein